MELELSKWLFLSPIQHFWGVILYRKQVIISYVISCTFICARQGYQIWQPNWVKWDKSATFSDQIQEELRIQIFICIQVLNSEIHMYTGLCFWIFGCSGVEPQPIWFQYARAIYWATKTLGSRPTPFNRAVISSLRSEFGGQSVPISTHSNLPHDGADIFSRLLSLTYVT